MEQILNKLEAKIDKTTDNPINLYIILFTAFGLIMLITGIKNIIADHSITLPIISLCIGVFFLGFTALIIYLGKKYPESTKSE